ncbi:hypothetical protein Trydic_g17897 [Trypoxylus dichotomus]
MELLMLHCPRAVIPIPSPGKPHAVPSRTEPELAEESKPETGTSTYGARIAGRERYDRVCGTVGREGQLNFARQHIQLREKWKKVVFTDEKQFSVDGPDGFQHYWHNLRKEPKVISGRSQGGEGVMVWGPCLFRGS